METTVIIPTLGTRPREAERAIASVLQQPAGTTVPLVVINGDRYDRDWARALCKRCRAYIVPSAGVSNARAIGVRLVETECFAFLDDDDEFLPTAADVWTRAFQDGHDWVATNGFKETAGELSPLFDFSVHSDDPAVDLLNSVWLCSASAAYRADRVLPSVFEDLGNFLEITQFGLRLTERFRVNRVDEPTCVIHATSRQRASQSRQYLHAIPEALAAMHSECSRADLREILARSRTLALHDCSDAALRAGRLREAWDWHLKSLRSPGGWKHWAYMRRLMIRSLVSRREQMDG
jgi:hypothetical protein